MHTTVAWFWKNGHFLIPWVKSCHLISNMHTFMTLHFQGGGCPEGGGGRMVPPQWNWKPPGTITNGACMQIFSFLNSKTKKYIPFLVFNFLKDFVSLCNPERADFGKLVIFWFLDSRAFIWYATCLLLWHFTFRGRLPPGGGVRVPPPMKLKTSQYHKWGLHANFQISKLKNKEIHSVFSF